MNWKGSLLVTWKILRLFVNTMTAHDKYSVLNRDNLTQQIQMHLFQKEKKTTFSQFFLFIFGICIKFWTFSKQKLTLKAYLFPKLQTLKDVIGWTCKKSCCRGLLVRQHSKRVEILFRYQRQNHYHTYWSLCM